MKLKSRNDFLNESLDKLFGVDKTVSWFENAVGKKVNLKMTSPTDEGVSEYTEILTKNENNLFMIDYLGFDPENWSSGVEIIKLDDTHLIYDDGDHWEFTIVE